MAASFWSTSRTTSTSPALSSSARYSSGMRRASIAPNRLPPASASWPWSLSRSTTGDNGGMYQTMGMVRYSGCSGRATLKCLISAYTGDFAAASSQSSGIPLRRASAMTSGSVGSSIRSSWAW